MWQTHQQKEIQAKVTKETIGKETEARPGPGKSQKKTTQVKPDLNFGGCEELVRRHK